jgi:GAF domain-containing protein
MAIMHSDFASMQVYDLKRNALRLLTYRGLAPSAVDAWTWIYPHSGTSCAMSLTTRNRTIVTDIELCADLKHQPFRDCGIRAMQTTPLRINDRLVGMVSTHWRTVHRPTDSELHLFDLWAQQTADVMVNNDDVAKLLNEAVMQIARSKKLTQEFELVMLQHMPVSGSA